MSMLLQKGQSFSAEYTSTDYPTLSSDWTGDISFYIAYPGVATFTKSLVRVSNTFTLSLTIGDILGLEIGVYTAVTTIVNPVLGVSVASVEYATVLPIAAISSVPMTKLYATIAKPDGSPAGREIRTLLNTDAGVAVVLGWEGVSISASAPVADAVSGEIIGIERAEVVTNKSGYAELYVVKGLTYSVNCTSFGKTVAVNTTGLDTIDLSTFF